MIFNQFLKPIRENRCMHCNSGTNDPIFWSQTFYLALLGEWGLFLKQRMVVDLTLEKLSLKQILVYPLQDASVKL